MRFVKLIFVFLVCLPSLGWMAEMENVYSFNKIYGCSCFCHCSCFSYYIGPFHNAFKHLEESAFPLDNRFHPKLSADVVWHQFMKAILTSKRDGPYFECNESILINMLQYQHENSICMLSDYLTLIEKFKNFYSFTKEDSIKYYRSLYPLKRDEKVLNEHIQRIAKQTETAHQILEEFNGQVIPLYKAVLANCPHADDIYNMAFVYNQGLIHFYEANYDDFTADAERYIQLAEIHDKKFLLDAAFYQRYGISQLRVNLYHQAIEALSKAIETNPDDKEAYFQRAVAYFEVGNFDQALLDYLISGKSKEIANIKSKVSKEFQRALLLGLALGGKDALVEFFPSLLHTAKGIGHVLWILAEHPLDTTAHFGNTCYEIASLSAEFFADFDWETVEEYAEEFRQLVENFNALNDAEKGHLIGYNIGKYGLEIFAGGAALKGIHSIKRLRDANRICNLEALAVSNANKEKVLASVCKFESERKEFFKNVKLHTDRQNKHTPGKHNYEPGKSILEHKNPQLLLEKLAGKGKPLNNEIPGAPNYRELVDFEEVIGIWINKENTLALPTTKGVIHYAKDGAHIIPAHPG